MSKTIKVSDEVFLIIQKYQGPRESYSHVIERAFSVFETITEVKTTLGPSHYLAERPTGIKISGDPSLEITKQDKPIWPKEEEAKVE